MDMQFCSKCGERPFIKEDHMVGTKSVVVPRWFDEEDRRNGAIPGYYAREEQHFVYHIYIVQCSECGNQSSAWEPNKQDAIRAWNEENKFRPTTDEDRSRLYKYDELAELFYHNEIDGAVHVSWTSRHKVLKGTDDYGVFSFLPSKTERDCEEPCWRVIGFKPETVPNEWCWYGYNI